jgi:mannose-1-phosphate guanylyltransferase
MNWVVILAGGSGTRFWPLSSPRQPKQLLPLAGGDTPSATATAAAVGGLVPPERTLVVTGADLAPRLGQALGLPAENLLIEPYPASTAPALVWATWEARRRDADAAVVSLHADWHLAEPETFRQACARALDAARTHDRLVTVGVVPTRAETGYGYLVPGAELAPGVSAVRRFTEKPDRETAEGLIAVGALWNSGLFAWTAERLLDEVRRWTPEVSGALPRLEARDVAGYFAAVQPVSIDVGLFERSDRVATLPAAFPWDDIGTWDALARVRGPAAAGNGAVGPAHLVDAAGCIVWSDGTPVVLSGVRDLVVVAANGRVLVLDRARVADLKATLEHLPPEVRELP